MGRHSTSSTAAPWTKVVGFASFAMLLAFLAFHIVSGTGSPAASGGTAAARASKSTACPELRIGAVPDVLDLVKAQLTDAASFQPCASVTVTALTAAQMRDGVPDAALPDAWISDAEVWPEFLAAQQTDGATPPALTALATIAESPVVLAVPHALATTETTGVHSWIQGLASLPLQAEDPNTSTASALAFTAVYQQVGALPGGADAMGQAFFQIIANSAPTDVSFSSSQGGATEAKVFPASEQRIYAYNQSSDGQPVAAMTPQEGAPLMKYQLLSIGEPSADKASALQTVARALTAEPAAQAFRAAGFRVGEPGQELVPGIPSALPGISPTMSLAPLTTIFEDWSRLQSTPQFVIAVDVSGSMREPAGDTTRIGLAQEAIERTLPSLPRNGEVALWAFSSGAQPGAADFKVLEPLGTVGSLADPASHGSKILDAVKTLPSITRGDTGLYDTIWTAYDAMTRIKGNQRMVVVVTDGVNDDPTGGLSEAELLTKLKAASKADNVIGLVLLGMGPDANLAGLKKIADAVGGYASVTADPADFFGEFASSLWGTSERLANANG